MARLPKPGGDDGTWGQILNDFLTQAHNPDGSLKQLDQSQIQGLVGDLAIKVNASDLSQVATTGTYADLSGRPVIPATAADVGAVSLTGLDAATAALVSNGNSTTTDALKLAYAVLSKAGAESLSTQTSVTLQPFGAALANRENAACNILLVGDSIREGEGATDEKQCTSNRLEYLLNSRFPTTGVTPTLTSRYVSAAHYTTTLPQNGTLAGAPSKTTNYGYGLHNVVLTTTAQFWTITVVGDAVDIIFGQATATGVGYYKLDGGSAVTFNTSNGGAQADTGALAVSLGSAGLHTLEIGWSSGGGVFLGGVVIYNGDRSKGIHVINSGHFGWTSTQWANATNLPRLVSRAQLLQPALVDIALGANDYPATDPATTKANLLAIIAAIDAVCTVRPSYTLTAYYSFGAASPFPWSQYVSMMQDIAAADTGVLAIDMTKRMPAVAGDVLGLYVDAKHPSPKGHAMLADVFTSVLTPR